MEPSVGHTEDTMDSVDVSAKQRRKAAHEKGSDSFRGSSGPHILRLQPYDLAQAVFPFTPRLRR
jgi:hypothetical protein